MQCTAWKDNPNFEHKKTGENNNLLILDTLLNIGNNSPRVNFTPSLKKGTFTQVS